MTNPLEKVDGSAGGTTAHAAAKTIAVIARAATRKGALSEARRPATQPATQPATWETGPGSEGSSATVLLQLAVWQQQL
jgi:hypothetical protein